MRLCPNRQALLKQANKHEWDTIHKRCRRCYELTGRITRIQPQISHKVFRKTYGDIRREMERKGYLVRKPPRNSDSCDDEPHDLNITVDPSPIHQEKEIIKID